MIRILLTGSSGQLGQALRASLPAKLAGERIELIATARHPEPSQGVLKLDLADPEACYAAVVTHQPDWVLNAGAYTAVDKAEKEPELAYAVNANAPRALLEALAEISDRSRLLQISTDYVFNGQQSHPYRPNHPIQPLNVYGASKAAGEQAITGSRATIMRTGWVYGPVGSNFLLTMLRLHHQKYLSGEPLRVVSDQVGCPTSTAGLARACWATIDSGAGGILHWSDAGVASWYDFAVAIGELGVAKGLLKQAAVVEPINTADYAITAHRPSYSLLDCTETRTKLSLSPHHWRLALDYTLQKLIQASKN